MKVSQLDYFHTPEVHGRATLDSKSVSLRLRLPEYYPQS